MGKEYKCIASPRYSTFRTGNIYKPEDVFLCDFMNFCSDCFEPIENEQKPADLKTKAGNWYICDKEVMNENMVTAFHRNEIYYCPKDGYLDVGGALFEVGCLDIFRLATDKEIPQPEQKPAWSEEDTSLCVKIQGILSVCKSYSLLSPDLCKEMCDWLKSLKDRALTQPKLEWSEEDEKMLNQIIKDYERGNESWLKGQGSLPFGNRITWLKSLIPQIQWRPSDEQMDALRYVANFDYGGHKATLVSLYEQLKKLREK
jgi:hypothetical protein